MRPDVMVVELTRREQRTYFIVEDNADLPPLESHIECSCKRRKVWVLEVGSPMLLRPPHPPFVTPQTFVLT